MTRIGDDAPIVEEVMKEAAATMPFLVPLVTVLRVLTFVPELSMRLPTAFCR
jgi:TRAP-type C4-dicarboxylate transport system permease large subunit